MVDKKYFDENVVYEADYNGDTGLRIWAIIDGKYIWCIDADDYPYQGDTIHECMLNILNDIEDGVELGDIEVSNLLSDVDFWMNEDGHDSVFNDAVYDLIVS